MSAAQTFPLSLLTPSSQVAPGWLRLLGVLLLLTAPLWFAYLFTVAPTDLPPGSGFVLVPVLIAIQAVLVYIATTRDRYLRQVMFIGSLAKLFAVSAFLYIAVQFYSFSADTLHYFSMGSLYAHDVEWNRHWELLRPFWSNNAVYMLTGAVEVFTGPSFQTVAVLFTFLSFWGEYFIYRSFCASFPNDNAKRAALLIFLLPSVVFWTAAIGKEAVLMLAIGFALYGAALLMRRITPLRILPLAAGLGVVFVVRPHVAAMIAMAFLFAWVLGKDAQGSWGVTVKVLTVPVLLAATIYLISSANDFLRTEGMSSGVGALQMVGHNNAYGGSRFGSASVTQRALAAPFLFFRPFPFEVGNITAAVASMEGLLLMFLTWKQRRVLARLVRYPFEERPAFFLFVFLVIYSIVFSAAITNFGLLARERSIAVPLLAMLLCLSPRVAGRRMAE